jgi:uncharacterized protein (TIGR03435 family)
MLDRTVNAIRVTTILVLCGTIYGQSDAPLKFEVASIKPSRAEDRSERASGNPASFDMNTTVRSLVVNAYQLQDYQLLGDPKWLNTEYFRIVAKPPAGSVPADQHTRMAQMCERLRSLLSERFQFAAHHETRDRQEYVIVVAKGGSKLREVPRDAANFKLVTGKGKIATRGGAKVELLARLLAGVLQYPVIDKTGLDGFYDIHLNYATEDGLPDGGASIFAALQEELGLKLETRKAPVDVLVIDHVDRPSEN